MQAIEQDLEMVEPDDIVEEIRQSKRIDLIHRIKRNEVTLSHSSFNEFCISPRHFMNYKLKDRVTTPAMALGSIKHCIVLEPDEFEKRYFVLPESDLNKNTNAYKALKADWIIEAGQRQVVSASDYAEAERVAQAIRRNDVASDILSKCTAFEVGVEWNHGKIYANGKNELLKWRGIMDGDGRKNGVIVDLKFLADASQRAVANYVKYEGAGRQAVHYLRGGNAEHCDYFILAVDKVGNCSVSQLGKGLLHQLSREIDWYLAQFARCVFEGAWNASYDFYGNQNGHFEIKSL